MDTELLLAIAVLAAMGVAVAFERRADAARKREAETASTAAAIVVIKMPEAVAQPQRVAKYDEPLEVALTRANLGRVIGGADLTVELPDLEPGLAFVKRELLRLEAPRETMLQFTRNRVAVAELVMDLHLEPGRRYRVIKAFTDHDRDAHPIGEEWTFLRTAFVPYHSGRSWFVSFDGVQETHIRMQSMPEEQGYILSNLAEFLVAV
jgi:uncharacterized protein DUF3601